MMIQHMRIVDTNCDHGYKTITGVVINMKNNSVLEWNGTHFVKCSSDVLEVIEQNRKSNLAQWLEDLRGKL